MVLRVLFSETKKGEQKVIHTFSVTTSEGDGKRTSADWYKVIYKMLSVEGVNPE